MDKLETFQPCNININKTCSGHILSVENVGKMTGAWFVYIDITMLKSFKLAYWRMDIVNY